MLRIYIYIYVLKASFMIFQKYFNAHGFWKVLSNFYLFWIKSIQKVFFHYWLINKSLLLPWHQWKAYEIIFTAGLLRQLFFWFRLRLWSGWWSERRSITQTTPGGSQRSSGNTTPTSSGVSSLTSTLSSWVIEICLRSSHTFRFITSCGHFWSLHCLCFQELLQKTSSPSRSFRFQSCLIYGEHNASVPLSEHTVNISNNLVWCPSGSWATSTRTVLSLSQSSALPFIWSWPGKIVTLFLKRSPPRWDPALWNQLWLQHHPLRYEI